MPDLATLLPLLALLLAIGALAGLLAGMLGVGGGIIIVSAFFYAFAVLGYESPYLMQICLATSLATIVFTSLRSVASHHRKAAVDWALLRTWAPGIAVGAVVGVLVAAALRSDVLQAIFGVLGLVLGLYLALGRRDWRLGDAMPGGAVRAVMSAVVGFLSVLMGIGGGVMGVPLMTLFGVPIHRAVGTAAGFGALIAVPSVTGFLLIDIPPELRPPGTVGAVNLPGFLVIVSMTMITAPLGAKLAHRTDPALLRKIFAVFVIVVAANMLRRALGA